MNVANTTEGPIGSEQTASGAAKGVAALTLDRVGRILDANGCAEQLFESPAGRLAGLHVSSLVPGLTEMAMANEREFRHFRYLCHCGLGFTAQTCGGEAFRCSLSFVELHGETTAFVRLVVTAADDDAFYCQ